MDEGEQLQESILAEFTRLGLDAIAPPFGGLGVAGGLEGLRSLLARLQSLQPGATWHELFPDLPQHWVAGRPEIWTRPYRPKGPYDYQALPTGPAIHVVHDAASSDWNWVAALVAEARAAGWPVYGAGPAPSGHTLVPGHAYVVLERGTSDELTWAVAEWLDAQSGLTFTGSARTGTEEYLG